MSNDKSDGKKISIKFLISNSQAGSLIGSGGKSIKEMIAVSNCRVNVSGPQEPYPGTADRVVLINGNLSGVLIAQQLVWEMIAHLNKAAENENKNNEWSPEAVMQALGTNDTVDVISKVSIPAACGGLILGRAGATIRSIAEESGAKVLMTSKDEALFTHERVLTISGEASQCMKAAELVILKLEEQDEIEPYVNRGTTYSSPLTTTFHAFNGTHSGGGRGNRTGGGGRGAPRQQQQTQNTSGEGSAVMSDTTITLSIPNELIGNIFGKQGSTMREIISLSGAKVVVSPRNEFVEGTTNRLLTITGTPTCAQTAHLFITQRLHTPSNPAPRNKNNSNHEKQNADEGF